MGIDAMMFVELTSNNKIQCEDLRRLSFRLVSTLGPEHFWIRRGEQTISGRIDGAQGALSWVHSRADGRVVLKSGDHEYEMPYGAIQVNLWGRYYGSGYERGRWMLYRTIAAWLAANIPGCTVWYGGDCDVGFEKIMDPEPTEIMRELDSRYFDVGNEPYFQSPESPYPGDARISCVCGIYPDGQMRNVGGGGSSTFYYCPACGTRFVWQSAQHQLHELVRDVSYDSGITAGDLRVAKTFQYRRDGRK